MQETMVSVRNLSKVYSGHAAVKRLDLDIGRGEFFGLLGRNGAGKTTTIGMLAGLIAPSEGNITVDGLELAADKMQAKSKIGFVPQEFAFYPSLTATDNLRFFGRIYGLHGKHLKREIGKALKSVELLDKAGERVETFSNGMKRRLNIAIGMLHDPKILILDEPTVGVDAHAKEVILENLQALNRAGTTILLATHHLAEAQQLCHRVAIINQGTVVALDTPSALMGHLGEGIVRVCFSKPVPASLSQAMAELGRVMAMDSFTVHILPKGVSADRLIRTLQASAATASVPIKRLSILEASLEAVFLHVTGRLPEAEQWM